MSNIVQSLWIGSRLPEMQQLSIRSFLAHGHQYHLYAYERLRNVPKGTTICDASSILPPERIFSYQTGFGKGSHSAFSNLFRYKMILEKGGWWVDTDVVCLRRFEFADECVIASEREDDYTQAATCVFKAPAGAEFLRYCVEVCESKDTATLQWGEIGPLLLDEAVKRFGLTPSLAPVHFFNPIHSFEFSQIAGADFDRSRIGDSYAVHLWNQMWKSNNVAPGRRRDRHSLYTFLEQKYPRPSVFTGLRSTK